MGPEAFGLIAVIRGVAGFAQYAALGLAPGMLGALAHARTLEARRQVCTDSVAAATLGLIIGALMSFLYGRHAGALHQVPFPIYSQAGVLALYFGLATSVRMFSEVPAAVLQSRGKLWIDQLMQIASDVAWTVLVFFTPWSGDGALGQVAVTAAVTSFLLAAARFLVASRIEGPSILEIHNASIDRCVTLLVFGGYIVLAQVADFLYAPTSRLIIDWNLGPQMVAAYEPCLQLDAALLVLSSAVAIVLLPRAASAAALRDARLLTRYYLWGTLATLAILSCAAMVVVIFARPLLILWLGRDLPVTLDILPLVMIHTVIGGASGVGRSMLIALGKVRSLALSAIVGGLCNVLLAILFVGVLELGIHGVVYATILSVGARCVFWMPWKVLRTIGELNAAAALPTKTSDES